MYFFNTESNKQLLVLKVIIWHSFWYCKYCMDVRSFLEEKDFASRKFTWLQKSLCLRKTSLIKEKPWLVEKYLLVEYFFEGKSFLVKNFLDEGKTLVCGKLPWWRRNLGLWKTSLMKEKSWLLEENFFEKKNLCLWKTSFMKEKYLLMVNVLDERTLGLR